MRPERPANQTKERQDYDLQITVQISRPKTEQGK